MTAEEGRKNLKMKAISLLARREYSRKELVDKFIEKKTVDEGQEYLFDDVLLELEESGLQSDQRFSDSFVRTRKAQGKGPCRIRQELSRKGISGDILDAAMVEVLSTAQEDLKRVYESKYRNAPVQDQKDKARRLRFLVSRGFSPSQIYPLLSLD